MAAVLLTHLCPGGRNAQKPWPGQGHPTTRSQALGQVREPWTCTGIRLHGAVLRADGPALCPEEPCSCLSQ